MSHINRLSAVAGLILSLLCASGCFQSQTAFYTDKDLISDPNFVGTFSGQANPREKVVIEKIGAKGYAVTYSDGSDWIKMKAHLFTVGKQQFADLIYDSGQVQRNAGGAVGGMEIVKAAFAGGVHVAIPISITEDQIKLRTGFGNDLFRALKAVPDLKLSVKGEGLVWLEGTTAQLQKAIAQVSSDERALPHRGVLGRVKPSK